MTNLFELATRSKFRFSLSKGLISTEDLWDLKLEDLDTLAKSLNKELKDSTEESFIQKRTVSSKALEAKFEIVKHIIAVKLSDRERREKALANATKRAKLQELIEKKQESALEGKSVEELQAEIDALED